MIEFFNLDGELPVLNKELRVIPTFRKIIERDKSKNKEIAMKELAFLYYITNKKLYSNYTQDEKIKILKKRLELPAVWTPDELLEEGANLIYEDNQTPVEKLLEGAKETINNTVLLLKLYKEKTSLDIERLSGLTNITTEELNSAKDMIVGIFELSSRVPKILEDYNKIEIRLKEEEKTYRKGSVENPFEKMLRDLNANKK